MEEEPSFSSSGSVPFPLPTPLSGFWGSSRHGCGLGQAGLAQRPSGILPCLAQVLAGGGKPRNWSPSSMAPHPAVSGACSKTSLGTRQQDGRQPSGSVATGVAGDSSDLAWASGLALAARKPTPTNPQPEVPSLSLHPQPHPLPLKGSIGANILNHQALLKIRCFCQRATFYFLQALISMQPTERRHTITV